jgi:hypothetical protein
MTPGGPARVPLGTNTWAASADAARYQLWKLVNPD